MADRMWQRPAQTPAVTSASLSARLAAFWQARSRQGAAGLLLFGWSGTLVACLAAIALSFLLVYWTPYWRRADMDIMMVYQAFLVNSGHTQDFFDHPGHLHVLLISAWFKLLHWVGFLDVVTLADMPPASDLANFEQVWTAGVRAGRLLSLAIVSTLVVAFAFLLRRLVTDWRVAALGTFMFAFSSGGMWHAHVVRTGMLAAGPENPGGFLVVFCGPAPPAHL